MGSGERGGATMHNRHVRGDLSLSERILGIEWPIMDLGEFRAVPHDHERSSEFVRRHYADIFSQPESRFLIEENSESKARFVREMDVYSFESEGEIVGVSYAHPSDWSSYYFRSFALRPDAQARGIPMKFMRAACGRLREAGVRRAEAECLPTNAAMQRTLAAGGFVVTGSVASERWGFVLRLTKFLDDEAHDRFVDLFSPMPRNAHRRRTP